MSVSYDVFNGAFLAKISDYDFLTLPEDSATEIIDGCLKRAVAEFKYNCDYDLTTTADDTERRFDLTIDAEDLDELVDIISDGMVVQWLKPYLYKQELLSNVLNTRDYTLYSPAELLLRVGNAHAAAKKNYDQSIREYSYRHTDISNYHI